MSVRVTCPEDSWPNKPTEASFPTLAAAQQWAEWGHFCVRADLHKFTLEAGEAVTP